MRREPVQKAGEKSFVDGMSEDEVFFYPACFQPHLFLLQLYRKNCHQLGVVAWWTPYRYYSVFLEQHLLNLFACGFRSDSLKSESFVFDDHGL